VQHGGGLQDLQQLPELPRNARYVHHANECLDIGTVGWVLDNHVPDPKCARCSAGRKPRVSSLRLSEVPAGSVQPMVASRLYIKMPHGLRGFPAFGAVIKAACVCVCNVGDDVG